MPKINLLKSETPIRIKELKADYDKNLLSTLANTSVRDIRNYLSFKLVAISSEAKALHYTVAMVCSAKFIKALQKYAITPEVEESTFQSFLEDINQLLKRRDTGSFDIDRFWKSELVQDYAERLLALAADQVDEKQQTRIRVYMRDYCLLFFKELLSSETTIYNKLLKFLISPLHLAQQERYYRDKYYIDLKHEYTSVTLNDPKGMTLDHVYQEPGFSVFNRCLTERKRRELKDKENDERFVTATDLKIKQDIHAFTLRWLQRKFVHDDFEHDQSRILLLYGYPGQGKTSFCKRLVHDLLGEEIQEQSLYMLRFGNIERPELLKSEILSTVRDHLNERYKLALVKEDLTSSLLVLDGLDELLMKNNLKTSDVDDIIKSLIYEIKLHSDLRIIVTSRHGYLNHEALKISELLVLSLNEFDQKLQMTWLTSYMKFHPESWLDLEKLTELNNGENYLKELLGQPILLHMIAALEEDITEEVPNRAKVYELLFEQLTDPKKWKERQIDVLDGLEAEDLRLALREIAFKIFIQGKGYIHKSALEKLGEVDRLRKKLEAKGESFREALKIMMVAFYFQEKPKERGDLNSEDNYSYAIEFLHKSLQEYLTAEYIWFTIQEELLTTKNRGHYIIEQDEDILSFLQAIFGFQPLSKEVVQYLIEIIRNDDRENVKRKLVTRLRECMDYCLDRQFVYSFHAERQTKAIDLGIMVFYGFWIIYSNLQEKKEFFNEKDPIEKILGFTSLFKSVRVSNLPFRDLPLEEGFLANRNLIGANLIGANLIGARLVGFKFIGADLSGADLSTANLSGANFIRANLIGANLSGADLSDADFSGANLIGANLSGANLKRASFIRSNFIGAILSKASLFDANFSYANFNEVKYLSTSQLKLARTIHEAMGIPTDSDE